MAKETNSGCTSKSCDRTPITPAPEACTDYIIQCTLYMYVLRKKHEEKQRVHLFVNATAVRPGEIIIIGVYVAPLRTLNLRRKLSTVSASTAGFLVSLRYSHSTSRYPILLHSFSISPRPLCLSILTFI